MPFVRTGLSLAFLAIAVGRGAAATPKEIDAAIQKGTGYLKARLKGGQAGGGPETNPTFGIGPTALGGIALIEAKVPANDATLQAIAATVRDAAYAETRTYQIALCLIFLDRLEDPNDVPLIQVLAVRLLAGQTNRGGWEYGCIVAVSGQDQQWLRANLKANVAPAGKGPDAPMGNPFLPGAAKDKGPHRVGKLHPDVEKYAASLVTGGVVLGGDDNSNTQFGVLALWVARKHGVPVEAALDAVEKRFRATQEQNGTWGYSPMAPGGGSPSMTCCGLLGLATGVARRDERRAKVDPPAKDPPAKSPKPNDPFFTPAPRSDAKANEPKREPRDPAVNKALEYLGAALASYVQTGGVLSGVGGVPIAGMQGHGHRDLYFLWSLERVGVIYGVDKLGGVDWYEVGAEAIVRAQAQDGSWGFNGYGAEANAAFALLFLLKADLARDLSSRVKKTGDNELRAGNPPAAVGPAGTAPLPKAPGGGTRPLPSPVEDESSKLAAKLLLTQDSDWTKALETLRDAKGGDYTKALVVAIYRVEGDRKKEVREALAERLTRMSAETLKGMVTSDDPELRRSAVLACAMKDDKAHVPDLIDRLTDEEDLVVRAAKAGLKSLTGRDFGPMAGATKLECRTAAAAWRAWWAKQK